MKTNFKFFALVAMALAIGFSSCSKSDDGDPSGEKKVVVQMSMEGLKSRAVGSATAVGELPNLTNLALIFVGNGTVQKVEDISLTTGTNQADLESGKSFTVPTATSRVYAIGNTALDSSLSLPGVGDTEASVKALALSISASPNDYEDVLLSAGQAGATGGTAFDGASFTGSAGSESVSLDIVPAFARYEISRVSVNASATQPLASFTLEGIFITNTYRTIGLDYSTVATATADVFNFGPGTSGFDGAVQSYLKDIISGATGSSFYTPSGGTVWHYMLTPPIAGKGTTLEGSTGQETSIPIIVLKVGDIVAGSGNNNTYTGSQYITVRVLKSGSTTLTYLRPGYVYQIADIAFGGENLTSNPGEDKNKDVTVEVTFKPWQGEAVTPEL